MLVPMAKILECKQIKEEVKEHLKSVISNSDLEIALTIIQIGERDDSNAYIEHKKKFGKEIGVKVEHIKIPERTSEEEVLQHIEHINANEKIHGVILQLPIPDYLDKERILQAIDPRKDVDGLTIENRARLYSNQEGFVPATARGVVKLLDYYDEELEGKSVLVIGRSFLAGKPIAMSLLNRNMTVTMAHSYSENISDMSKKADYLVVAAGVPEMITKDFVHKNQVVIDVGIHSNLNPKGELEVKGKRYTGDVDFDDVENIVRAISPVPGGVGQLTVASLYENLLDAFKKQL
jgi:methylenetetrahydrofolate dehydrogenase (NADP+) / methenyltetrahydrofolate cyclohydrolase